MPDQSVSIVHTQDDVEDFFFQTTPATVPKEGLIRSFLLRFLASGHYNGYYLSPLEDGSYVCVYFDDYLMLHSGDELPTGYIRYITTEEKTMLHQMAEDYEVDLVYVLDMYRHG